MINAQSCRRVVVDTDDQFSAALHEFAVEVALAGEAEETAYEYLDSQIAERIDIALRDLCGADGDGSLYHQNYDWWPTRTRFLELDSSAISWKLLTNLQSLLTGDVDDWRMNIHVYRPLDSHNPIHVGAISVYRDWLLIQKPVLALLDKSVE